MPTGGYPNLKQNGRRNSILLDNSYDRTMNGVGMEYGQQQSRIGNQNGILRNGQGRNGQWRNNAMDTGMSIGSRNPYRINKRTKGYDQMNVSGLSTQSRRNRRNRNNYGQTSSNLNGLATQNTRTGRRRSRYSQRNDPSGLGLQNTRNGRYRKNYGQTNGLATQNGMTGRRRNRKRNGQQMRYYDGDMVTTNLNNQRSNGGQVVQLSNSHVVVPANGVSALQVFHYNVPPPLTPNMVPSQMAPMPSQMAPMPLQI